jgi:hypothetical protein
MIGRMIRAFGADDIAPVEPPSEKLRFQMIADTLADEHAQCPVFQ